MRLNRRTFLGAVGLLPALRRWRATAAPAQTNDLRVIVVGAGAAGLSAARTLRELGLNVRVLEARPRLGGRIWTDRTTLGTVAEGGAGFIHGISHGSTGEVNPLYALATEQGWRTVVFSDLAVQGRFNGTVLAPSDLEELFALYADFEDYAHDRAITADLETPLGAALEDYIALNELDATEAAALRAMLTFNVEQAYGADAADMSLRYYEKEDMYDVGGDLVLPDGYDQLPEFLARGLDIRLDEPVESIDYGRPVVRITTSRGEHEAEFVLVTVPVGVLRAGGVAFTPDLPAAKRAAIDRLRMGVQNKVLLRFPQRFWPAGFNWFAQIQTTAPYGLALSNFAEVDPGSPVLAVWQVGAVAAANEGLSDAQAVAAARAELQRIFPETVVPEPAASWITRWNSDPFSRGSYPHLPAGAGFSDMDTLAEPVGGRLFFAGDATYWRFYGTVHGAYLSGQREAMNIQREAARRHHRLAIRAAGPGSVELTWQSDPAFLYQLERSTALSAWTPIGDTVPGTGTVLSATQPTTGAARGFFRLRVE